MTASKLKLGLLVLLGLTALSPNRCLAEGNIYQYITGLGQVGFNQGGGVFLPPQVLEGMQSGDLSPVMEFVLVDHVFNQCVINTYKTIPARRDPYVVAAQKFTYGVCEIKKCFQNAMVMVLLPQMSCNPDVGGSQDPQQRQGAQQTALLLLQVFQKDPACDGSKGGNAIDPNLIMLIQRMNGQC